MTKDVDFAALRITLSDRYTLLRPLATGGMAEIFLARQKSLAGFDKQVAVKLLRDRYRSDPRVVEMFMNEARIGAVLSHPNVVHVYDIGEHDRQPFIVMEHIQGEELSQLCRRGLELAHFLPLEHAVDLVRQAAEALGYVHARRDGSGRPLDLVHRDISPSNLLVTNDGVLKIIDFGIARADWGEEPSEGDKLVPGKYNYMSPEQVRGERVDHRSDVFSLGVVLYEITVGKRLFKGRPEEVMQKVTRGRIKPPTFIRRQFPPALERIVMRALEAHRDDRYATAYELAADLEEFLREAGLKSGPVRIAQYLDELRTAEGGERRPELIIAGEAWLDDDGEEALDFDRGFTPSASPSGGKPATGPTSLARARDVEAPRVEEPAAPVAEVAPVVAVAHAPVVQTILPATAPAAATPVTDEEPSTKVASPTLPTETVPLRTVPRRGLQNDDGEEATNVHPDKLVAVEPPIEDLGEDSPTDASVMLLPELAEASLDDASGPVPLANPGTGAVTLANPARPVQPASDVGTGGVTLVNPSLVANPAPANPATGPIVLAEPTGRVPLTMATNKVPLVPMPMPVSKASVLSKNVVEAAAPVKLQVPLRAEPTGKVTLVPPPMSLSAAVPPPPSILSPAARAERAAEAARLAAIDPAMQGDTPLPPVLDPMIEDTTSRHPLSEPLLDGFVAASGMRILKAEISDPSVPPTPPPGEAPREINVADSMSVTMGLEPATPAKVRAPSIRGKNGKHAKKAHRPYRPRNLDSMNLEIVPDPVAASVSFGDGVLQKSRKNIPWPLIIGAGLALLLIILLMTR